MSVAEKAFLGTDEPEGFCLYFCSQPARSNAILKRVKIFLNLD
jgi:hypothetical protein